MYSPSLAQAALVRTATEADAPHLVELMNGLSAESDMMFLMQVPPETGHLAVAQYVSEVARTPGHLLLVAELDHCLIALANATGQPHPAKQGVLEIALGVRAAYHRRGVGWLMLAAIERWAIGNGAHRLQLIVARENVAAVSLYRKTGFRVEGLLRRSGILNGQFVDEFLMAKLL